MNGKRIFKTVMLLLLSFLLRAQEKNDYHVLHFVSAHTSFPDTGRAKDWLDGDGVLRPVAGHYDDNSVLLVVPDGLKPGTPIDLVFWFHGWHNSIDTALEFYGLARQFAASRRNAVLVLAEAAKNSADSYGGKLKQKGMFKGLVNDVMAELKAKGFVASGAGGATAAATVGARAGAEARGWAMTAATAGTEATGGAGHIVLAGHSGGFLVIANILANGQVPVDEVFLFDALYSQVPIFMSWIDGGESRTDGGESRIDGGELRTDGGESRIDGGELRTDSGKGGHHFVHWYTNHGGGTDEMTDTLMRRLESRSIGYKLVEENAVTPAIIRSNRVLLVHSLREHNVIINNPDDFEVLLENSWVLSVK
jgi:hypothetical protein